MWVFCASVVPTRPLTDSSLIPLGKCQAQFSAAPPVLLPPLDGEKPIVGFEEQNYTHTISNMKALTPARIKVTMHVLSDDVFLEIFDHCRGDDRYCTPRVWIPLVHVCRRWRRLIFASLRLLRLLLFCDVSTPARELLNIWPQIPIAIRYSPKDDEGEENVIAAFERHNCITWIVLDKVTSPVFKRFASTMHKPFPALVGLYLQSFSIIG